MSLRSDLEKLADAHWQNEYVKIKPILTESDLIYAGYKCQIKDEQKDFVNPFWFSIGRAYLFKEDNYPCIIYNAENVPIGFINFSSWLAHGDAYSWSYFIDKSQQGKGYGRHSAQLAIHLLKSANPEKQIKLSTESCNMAAQSLYTSLGFNKLDELDGDDIVFGL
jgi:diamine N-acetyltransferase